MRFLVVFFWIWYNKLEDIVEKRICKEKKVWVSVVDVEQSQTHGFVRIVACLWSRTLRYPGLYYDIPDHSLLCPLSSLQMRGSDDPQLLLLLYNPFNHSFLCQSGYSQSASPPATTVYESHPAVIQPLRRIHTALRADADSPSCQDFPERVQEVRYRLRRAIPQTSRRCQAVH